MQYSEIKKHIINKRYYWNYIIIILISLILAAFSFYSTFALLFFLISIISIGCIMINLYRCRSFYKLYHNLLKEYDVLFIKIEIHKEDYKMQVPYKSYNAKISPFPKSTNAIYIEENEFIMLFFSMPYLGVLQLVLKPIIFIKTDKELSIKDTNINIIQHYETFETEQGRIIIFPNKNGIKKIIIPDK